MSAYQTAIDYVAQTLQNLAEQGVEMSCSSASLARLGSSIAVETARVKEEASAPDGASRVLPEAPRPQIVAEPRPVAEHQPVPKARPELGGDKIARLEALRGPVLQCTLCPHLAASRTQVVFGVGNPDADLMFVGEAPGEDEDLQGEPFVGKAGQLLTKIIEAMGFKRSEVYIANVLKCRPDMPGGGAGNRKPKATEMSTCLPYLKEQISIIRPKALVALGATAMEGLLGETQPMARLRGRWHALEGTPVMATYHPAYLLRNQSLTEKRKVWEDMLLVLEKLALPISEKQRQYFLNKS
jgi:uracil-DNA glycosylase family 4